MALKENPAGRDPAISRGHGVHSGRDPSLSGFIMAISKTLADELERRRAVALEGGGKKKAEARHAQGRMTARERLDALFSKGTFQEFGLHAQHKTRHFGMDKKTIPTDAVISGSGFIDGRPVAAFSQDFGVVGGSLGKSTPRRSATPLIMQSRQASPSSVSTIRAERAFRKALGRCLPMVRSSIATFSFPALCRKSRSSQAHAPVAQPTARP